MEDIDVRAVERKKRSLKRYKKNLANIARLEARRDALDEKIKSVKTSSLSGMPRGGIPVTSADMIADKIELEERIERLKTKRRDLKKQITEEIDTLDDARHAEILESFFIDCKSLEDIAEDEGYTVRHVYRLYSEAVTILALTSH